MDASSQRWKVSSERSCTHRRGCCCCSPAGAVELAAVWLSAASTAANHSLSAKVNVSCVQRSTSALQSHVRPSCQGQSRSISSSRLAALLAVQYPFSLIVLFSLSL